ncbi:hypothetical protein SAY87_010998 [Trapa incisa]|uniref:BHLH domain-containing protein n=1 Tax=Trapa incisa TaxID=236973 RepID=A0AAN7GFG1_9MYRT|nr:hypothetical protein SAY87_010998 [Trapa incisa]
MPLFELFRLAKGKLGPPQEKPTSSPAGGSSPMPIAAPRGKVRSHNKTAALDLLHKESARGTDEDAAAVYVTNTCNTKPIGSPSALGKGQALPRTISAPQKGIAFKAVPDGKSSKQPISVKKSGAVVIQGEDALKEDKQSWQPSRTAKGGPSDGEKTLEPIGVSSSICSGNDVGGACDDMKHIFKRKYHEAEDSEGCSDDVEEELVSAKRQTAGGDIPRRNRVAEVHNLSERRRRDRINEKMHALQELIPSCNKVDKASMLDEAIEYIKTLKLQLQMVTMGTGMCMMPTMPSTRMQNMEHMPHYPYLGMGMIPAMHAMASSMYGLCGPGFTLPMACTPPGPNSASGVPLPVGNQDLTMVSNDKRSVQNTTCLTEKQQNSQFS